MLFNVLYFLCISLSISYAWSFSDIFKSIRNKISKFKFSKPLICPECCSFWIGLMSSFIYNPFILDFNLIGLTNILCGLVTHLFACFLYKNKNNNNSKINFIN
jgi:hypothetical protein